MTQPPAAFASPHAPNALPTRDDQTALLAAIGVLLAIELTVTAGRTLFASANVGSPDTVARKLDPNAAPWWELAQLPGIGEVTAKAIVAHRQTAAGRGPVYRTVDDLQAVKGIGPKRAAGLRDHLRFPDDS
jgi:DNA uptake protein ComE-like DNA-binding protein